MTCIQFSTLEYEEDFNSWRDGSLLSNWLQIGFAIQEEFESPKDKNKKKM